MITWTKSHFYGEVATLGNTKLEIIETGYRDTKITKLYQDGQLVDRFDSIDAAKDYCFKMYGEC